ncbi:MAG: hypothetical protein PHX18_02300 [Candidatus Gastranaerophilales bacterium]|nr:hypothetical protein [Candidatus Gastranaerophilales bacterium]
MQISNNYTQSQKTSFSSVIPVYNILNKVKAAGGAADTFERITVSHDGVFKALTRRLNDYGSDFAKKLKKADFDFSVTPYSSSTHVGKGTIIKQNVFTGQDAYDLRSMQRNNCCGLERVEYIDGRVKANYINNPRKQLRAADGERLGMNLFVKKQGKAWVLEDFAIVKESQRNTILQQQAPPVVTQSVVKEVKPVAAQQPLQTPKSVTIEQTPYKVDFMEIKPKKRGRKPKNNDDIPNLPGF